MAEFNRLFNRLFKIKTKKLHILLFFQIIAALACAFFTYYEVINWHIRKNPQNNVGILPEWALYFVFLAFFVIFFVYFITPLQSEKFNRSQTWRLAAISDGQFYLVNVLSTFVSFIYFIVLEFVTVMILLFSSYLTDKPVVYFFRDLLKSILRNLDINVFWMILSTIVLAILSCFFLYFVIGFFNFASRAILDFVPANINGAVVKVLHIFIIFGLIWFFFKIQNIFVYQVLLSVIHPTNYGLNLSSSLPFAILANAISDLILLGSNIFLINHFYEATEHK
ncbi:hypothetical protein [uncultured Lactobacillus sp.]|uniref:hypothetical protein n=1 Tax=uncultured Lactobacillus sp. TaxID=153152 RepID=UPI0025EB1383|nr:hypothetical protein [uncultured Lactobacillus sp.]